MKGSCKSMEVFEFREEDDMTEAAARSIPSRIKNTRTVDRECSLLDRLNRESEFPSKRIRSVACGDVNVVDIHHNRDSTSSLKRSESEDFSNKKMLESICGLPHNLKLHNEAAEINSNILEHESGFPFVECSLSPGDPACLKNQADFAFPESSFSDELGCVASDAEDPRNSSNGPSPENCFSGWDLADDTMDVFLYPDYIDYCGRVYLDPVVNFSRSFVEIKCKTTYGVEGSFHLQLEIDDIVKIESQWNARYKIGTVKICFIAKGGALDDTVHNESVSRIHELKFPAVDSKWYEKLDAIESLNLRYKALWRVILDIGMEKCSASPDWKDMILTRRYFPQFDKPFDEVIYPKGDPDAVSISKRDIDLLLPDTFVNDTIIDFYIKFLKNRQKDEDRIRFHFFNSFFFRKLADMDKDPSSAFDGKSAFQRVRKWTRKINLLEKDFIFIPVNYNYHWSLIVICYFGEIASNTDVDYDKSMRVPCILHMDSFRGNHGGLKDLMQSYLWEEWKERQKEICEDPSLKFRNLKFVSLELPQQQNLYDCGLFLLHYVELFLEDVPTNFSIHSLTSSSNFLQPDWFPPGEASMKRARIERLIYEVLESYFEDCSSSSGNDADCSPNDPSTDYDNKQDIEVAVLPDSAICTRNSGLSPNDLFEPGCSSRSYNDVHLLGKMRRPDSLVEEEVQASEQFLPSELEEPASQHAVGLTLGASLLLFSSGDFRLEPDPNVVLEDADSSPATSSGKSDDTSEVEADEKYQSYGAVGLDNEIKEPRCILSDDIECSSVCFASVSAELINAAESCNHDEINDNNAVAVILNNSSDYYQETKQVQGNCSSTLELLPSSLPFAFRGTMCSPDGRMNSNDSVYPCTGAAKDSHISSREVNDDMTTMDTDDVPLLKSEAMRAAKRMRTADPYEDEEPANNLSNGLNF